jgi:hypothetical protein
MDNLLNIHPLSWKGQTPAYDLRSNSLLGFYKGYFSIANNMPTLDERVTNAVKTISI